MIAWIDEAWIYQVSIHDCLCITSLFGYACEWACKQDVDTCVAPVLVSHQSLCHTSLLHRWQRLDIVQMVGMLEA